MLRAVQASSPALWDRSVHLVEIHLPIEGEAWVIRQDGDSATIWLLGGVQVGSGVSEALGGFVATFSTSLSAGTATSR